MQEMRRFYDVFPLNSVELLKRLIQSWSLKDVTLNEVDWIRWFSEVTYFQWRWIHFQWLWRCWFMCNVGWRPLVCEGKTHNSLNHPHSLPLYYFWLAVGGDSMNPMFVKLVSSLEMATWLAIISGLAEHAKRTPATTTHGWEFLVE